MLARLNVILILSVVASACGGGDDAPIVDASSPSRDVTLTATVGPDGLSEEVAFEVPDSTRSATVIVTGAADALYALGALRTPDGVDQVMLPAGNPGPAMASSYNVEQIGQMPGNLYQSIRLGTFTQVYPYRPGQALTAGRATLRVASDTPGPVQVRVLLAPDDGARTLHSTIVVFDVIDVAQPPSFLDEVQALMAPAGITVVVDRVVTLTGTALENITQSTEPQESPVSMSSMLPGLVADMVDGPALDLFIVESLPAGIGGLSLGTPGPPVRGGYYYGVVIRSFFVDDLSRPLASSPTRRATSSPFSTCRTSACRARSTPTLSTTPRRAATT
ncbi:MAG: hypothetical protein R3B06_24550 [Kofleriaceae bacterium]